jgi:signal recognition particle GTPase
MVSKIDQLISGKRQIDERLLEELEEVLITSDIGVKTTRQLLDKVAEKVKRIAAILGHKNEGHAVLFSTRILKKTGLRLTA